MAGGPARAGDHLDGVFIAEGRLTVERVLDNGWPIESVLVSERQLSALGHMLARAVAGGAVVYTAGQDLIDAVAGFNVHRGVLAVVRRPPARVVADVAAGAGRTLLCVEGINDLENLGALFRNAAALGAGGVVLDPTAADPLYRRAVRVSMGHVLSVPFARAQRWPEELVEAAASRRLLALTPAGERTLDDVVSTARPDQSWAVMVGAEGGGLSPAAVAAADATVRIPMAVGVDSLNVATAAAIALYRLGAQEW